MNLENLNNQSSKERFISHIAKDGYCLVEEVIPKEIIEKLKKETEIALEKEIHYHGHPDYRDKGIIQCCPLYGGAFIEVLENKRLLEPYDLIMGEGNIIYVYISTCMPPQGKNFSSRIHVDRPRLFVNYCECLAGLVFLSDFTKENGATWILPGSQNQEIEPTEKEFYEKAIQVTGKAGSVLYFNLRLWHSGGINKTEDWRHALAIGNVRPYLKQKFDYPRMINDQKIDLTPYSYQVKQKLGFYAIPPKNLDEFYGRNTPKTYSEKSEWEITQNKKLDL